MSLVWYIFLKIADITDTKYYLIIKEYTWKGDLIYETVKENSGDAADNGAVNDGAIDDAGDAIRDGADDAGDAIRDGADDAGDAIRDGADDLGGDAQNNDSDNRTNR